MSKTKRQQTTAMLQPQQPPDVIQIPQKHEREKRPRVVYASNQSVPVPIGLLLLSVYIVLSFTLAYFGGEWAGAAMPARLVFGALLGTVMAFATMAFITGDAAALFESWQGERTERKELDVEESRIDATLELALAATAFAAQESAQRHTETMARLGDYDTTQQLLDRLASVESRLRIEAKPAATGYVAAVPEPARTAARQFIRKCYTDDGYNADVVHPNGGLIRAPWNYDWAGKPWCNDARQLLIDTVLIGPINQKRLRFETFDEADAALKQ